MERTAELAALVAALAGPPVLAVVEGEPGIGKTRLVQEALTVEQPRGRQLLVGDARPMRDPFPLGPLLEALASARLPPVEQLNPVVGALRGHLPERADELPPALERLDEPHAERHRTVRALVELLDALGPAVLVLEDVHWVDDRTVELLSLLPGRAAELAVVITYRPQDVPDASPLRTLLAEWPTAQLARIMLGPLSTQGVAELAAGVLGVGSVSPEAARRLIQRTGGVPFVLEEDVRFLRERGLLVEVDGVWLADAGERPDVPATVAGAVVERAARLSSGAHAALVAVAVLGGRADERLVGAMVELDPGDVAAGLSEGVAAGLLLDQQAAVAFRHALAGEAIYRAIPGPQRRRLHLMAARTLEAVGGETALGRLAYHYARAGETHEWARWAEAAADLATSLGEDETAFRYLFELLNAGAVSPLRRAEVTLKLSRVTPLGDDDAVPAAIALLREALDQADLPARRRGQLRLWLGWHRRLDPDTFAAGTADLTAAVAELADRPGDQARALATLAAAQGTSSTLQESLELLEAARGAAERSGEPTVQAHVAANEAWLLMYIGDPGAWEALEGLPAPSSSAAVNRQILRGLNNAADTAADLGHYQRARDIATQGLRLADELRYDRFVQDLRGVILRARWWSGDIKGAEAETRQLGVDEVALLRGELLFARGALEEADAVLSPLFELDLKHAARRAPRASASLVRIALARDDHAKALAVARRILEAVAATQIWVPAAHVLPFAPLESVRGVLADYRAGIADRDAPLSVAALAFADGRLAEHDGDHDTAINAYTKARGLYADIPDPRHAAHAAEAEARLRTALGEATGAQLYEHARRTFIELDAPWETNRVKQAMRHAGLRLPHRGGRRSYGNELSPREHEVAQLAASGHTNRQIAETLFLSPRTVDTHLANALRKLGITSRRDLPTHLTNPEPD